MAKNMQNLIASLMNETVEMGGIVGSPSARQNLDSPMDTAMSIIAGDCDNGDYGEEPEGYSESELKIAKRFVELIGGCDRARELLDKVAECEECLGLLDDEGSGSDENTIQKMAVMMPLQPDLPTSVKNGMDLASLYNPSAVGGSM